MTISDQPLCIAGRKFTSRLMVGTGKYRDASETALTLEASGTEVVV